MARPFAHYGAFLRQFRQAYRTTGSILPSSRFLAAALARYIGPAEGRVGRRILEAGPGTGAVTRMILAAMGPEDRLDLAELNDRFVAVLEHRFRNDEDFRPHARQCRILHQPVQAVAETGAYDLIVSGLPLNNFTVAEVEEVLRSFTRLLKPGGILSFFQYIAIRKAKAAVSGRAGRQRLRGIAAALDRLLDAGEVRRDAVWWNVPPAWVHHVRIGNRVRELAP